jgi:hypothetical protein
MKKGVEMELTYTETREGYLLPDLSAPAQTTADIGMWGRRRKRYLMGHRRALYAVMKTQGTLFLHLVELNNQAEKMWTRLIEELAASQGVDGELKRKDPMEWTGQMNAIRSQATEIVNNDLIYC